MLLAEVQQVLIHQAIMQEEVQLILETAGAILLRVQQTPYPISSII